MTKSYIAVDIGASSGRLILGWLEDGKLKTEEIHRFKNAMTFQKGHYHWDVDGLYTSIVEGLKKAAKRSDNFSGIGVDTWAVDYVLLNQNGDKTAPVYAYRDHRTDESMDRVFDIVPRSDIYDKTGIQFLQFNTLYQLFEHVRLNGEDFNDAVSFLMVPDYLHYCLSGVKSNEYTNATSTQMLDAKMRDWDSELLDLAGVDAGIMMKPTMPGTVLGQLTDDLKGETGIKEMKVIAPATHDTGSAVVSVPAQDKNYAYISSGTWSLMGIESDEAIISKKSAEFNFTNEGGVFGTYRVLKNIMGLWLIQEVQRMYDGKYSFAEFVTLARGSEPFKCIINPNDDRFINPENMIDAIQSYCRETDQYVPTEVGEIARCIFEGLAFLYRQVLEELQQISDQTIERIHIIGGGCQNKLLNQMCADFTGMDVHAGPIEATAIGNLAMQMIAGGDVKDLNEARGIIRDSFGIDVYTPRKSALIEESYKKFKQLQATAAMMK